MKENTDKIGNRSYYFHKQTLLQTQKQDIQLNKIWGKKYLLFVAGQKALSEGHTTERYISYEYVNSQTMAHSQIKILKSDSYIKLINDTR